MLSGVANFFSNGYSQTLYYAACYETTSCCLTVDQFKLILANQFKVPTDIFDKTDIFEQKILTNILQRESEMCPSIAVDLDISSQAGCAFDCGDKTELFAVIYKSLSRVQVYEIVNAYNRHYNDIDLAVMRYDRGIDLYVIFFNKAKFFSNVLLDLTDVKLEKNHEHVGAISK